MAESKEPTACKDTSLSSFCNFYSLCASCSVAHAVMTVTGRQSGTGSCGLCSEFFQWSYTTQF